MENQQLINFLNQLLSNQFVLYVKLHRYHWFIQGRNFFSLHEQFENMYVEVADDIDEIAERILMINGKPLATMVKYLKEATLEEASADDEEQEIIQQLLHDLQQMTTEIQKEGLPKAVKLEDSPTEDLLIGLQGKLEKYIWMLKAYLKK
ncbi:MULTISPECIES: Dps family protein [unclassified Virgibacillus]|uniref:Dps family protein n=1 Tax=unclassified Virgibacillus TaxID=2620237 RepID=UPI0009096D96|nr:MULTISPECIES: DNA starvation/stationary phase protection protein [unclassified Virgibacillus]API93965.1 DNA starvation/stationary phase protection protein [Virgibacillus sp. 6R]MBS7427489.1 DNA starvation/stationary phase protection protein [Virgibacillus sp. 19R1-5]